MSLYSAVSDALLERAFVYRLRQLLVDKNQTVTALRELSGGFAGKRVLELGCGPGTNTALFREAASYIGVDINPDYVRKASASFPDRSFVAADATRYRPQEAPDLVVIDSFLHHVDDEGVERILAHAATWLDGGAIVLQEPLIPDRRELYPTLMMRLDRGHHFRRLEHYRRLAAAAGLIVDEERFSSLRLAGVTSHRIVSMLLRRPAPVEVA